MNQNIDPICPICRTPMNVIGYEPYVIPSGTSDGLPLYNGGTAEVNYSSTGKISENLQWVSYQCPNCGFDADKRIPIIPPT